MFGIRTGLGHSIFGRLLFSFLLIIIPLYFGGISIYGWGVNTVRQEITSSMIAQVNNYLSDLERDIKSIQELQNQACVNDDDIWRLSLIAGALSDVDRTRAINRLRDRLFSIKSSSEYIADVKAYIPAIDRVIYATGNITEIADDEYEMLINSQNETASRMIHHEDKKDILFLTAFFPQQNLSNSRNPRIISVELSPVNLKNAMIRIDNDSNRGTMLFSTNSGFEISDGFGAETDGKIRSILEEKLQKSNHDTFYVEIRDIPYLAIYAKSDYLDMVLCKYIPENQVFASLKKYQIAFWVFTLIALIIITLFTFSTNRFINRPLSKLVNSFREVEGGNLEIRIGHNHNDEFGYLYKRFNAMVENLDVLIHQVYKQKILAQKAELKHLQSQINPHFLYNSFFSLHNMVVNGDYENVELFTRQLGTYFQFITRSAADVIPLEKEIAHARIYADIQSRRFRNRIKLEFEDLPEELKNIQVPRLIVQPLIENAFEHGLKNTVSDGLLRITFTSGDGRLLISVEDNGKEMSDAEIERLESCLEQENDENESTAIINIHRRIRIMFGEESGLKFSRGDLNGLKAEILIIYR